MLADAILPAAPAVPGATDVLAAARALEAAGRRVVHLEVGEPDASTPPHVVEAGVRALRDGRTRYGPTAGIPELRAAVAEALRARGVPADPARVLVTPGAKAALFSTLLAAVRPGDDVLVPDPGYGAYAATAELAGGRAVSYPLDASRDFALDPDAVAARLTARSRVLVLNAPHNPTGGVIAPDALAGVAALAARHDLLVVSDEIYARHFYPLYPPAGPGDAPVGVAHPSVAHPSVAHPSVASLPGMAERTAVVDGFSKDYAMTGWRLGYALLPPRLVAAATAVLANAATCTATFVQHAGVAALAGPQDALRARVHAFRGRRDRLVAALNALDGVRCPAPGGAFYAFPHVGPGAPAVARRLLERHGVACVAGGAFGPAGAEHLRFAYTAPDDDLAYAVEALRAALRPEREVGAAAGAVDKSGGTR